MTDGKLGLNPAGVPVLQSNGSKTISVKATSYNMNVGAVSATKSAVSVNPTLNENTTSMFTITAKDQYKNVVSGYQCKYYMDTTNNDSTTKESYTTNIVDIFWGFYQPAVTDMNGQTTFDITLPSTIDSGDGTTITPSLSDSSLTPFTFKK